MKVLVVILVFLGVAALAAGIIRYIDRQEKARKRARLDDAMRQAYARGPAEDSSVRILPSDVDLEKVQGPAVRADGQPVQAEPIRSRGAEVPPAVRQAQAAARAEMLADQRNRALLDSDITTSTSSHTASWADAADSADSAGSQDYGTADPVGSNDAAGSYDSSTSDSSSSFGSDSSSPSGGSDF